MVVGYVRLSRDDNKKNYASIENQKNLILTYAKQNDLTIDKFYEDDGVSGYLFNRPAFNQMIEDLENGLIDIVISKDLSRIGRNNQKSLSFIDRIIEIDKKLLIIDDNYNSETDDDGIIGIKTWYNERYVKDTSKKIRSILKMKQKEGSYICNAPLGYYINNKKFLVRENEAELVRKIFNMYISGYGYRNIANIFNNEGVQTPSVLIMQNFMADGKTYQKQVTTKWSDNMVRDIIKNDFYIGTLRTNKRERKLIHGTDRRVSKEKQYIFKNNHENIIDETTYNLAQELMVNRKRSNYRGSKQNGEVSIFGSVLFCNDCGSKLTSITRQTNNSTRKYYICSKYNSDGKNFCSSHLIDEAKLIDYTINYINMCKIYLKDLIDSYNIEDYKKNKNVTQDKINATNKKLNESKERLKSILTLKLNDIAKYGDNFSVVEETYENMEKDIISSMNNYEVQLQELKSKLDNSFEEKHENISSAYEVLQKIGETINRADIEYIIKRIDVDKNGIPEIILRYDINDYVDYTIHDLINYKENNIIKMTYTFIYEEERGYTSAKYLSKKLNEVGIAKNKKSVLPYINLAIIDGILEKTDDPLKPYTIVASKEIIKDVINNYMNTM